MKLIKFVQETLLASIINKNKTTCIVTPDKESSKIVIDMIVSHYKELPEWLKLKIVKKTKSLIAFNTGCNILIYVKPGNLRGFSISKLAYFVNDSNNEIPRVILRDYSFRVPVELTNTK